MHVIEQWSQIRLTQPVSRFRERDGHESVVPGVKRRKWLLDHVAKPLVQLFLLTHRDRRIAHLPRDQHLGPSMRVRQVIIKQDVVGI
jgi:hypothetical protein